MNGPAAYVLMAMVLFAGSAIQSATGFAFGLFSIPLLILLGLAPYEAIPMVGVSVIANAVTGLIRHRRALYWRHLVALVPLAIAAQPLGVWLLSLMVETLNRAQIRQVFGAILLVVLCVRWQLRVQPRDRLHPGWGMLAMSLCGLTSGMAGMGGPPVVLWTHAHRWSVERVRTTLWTIFSVLSVSNFLWQMQRFGQPVLDAALLGAAFVPATLLGTVPGLLLGARMSRRTLSLVATGLLIFIAVYALLQPLLPGPAGHG